uniref:Uncharacterized protein n=1 Tax=Timspurckia oligopyrenoides TaxID=708627 RepID=A0A7S0ZG81_9RHOD|mmetsp:Transcript_4020/g.7052  ORF Transcript_4020/g.7052 Transcript_4020/m.7052 type:complete len:157 (+) Transcript_4020:177-647(+)
MSAESVLKACELCMKHHNSHQQFVSVCSADENKEVEPRTERFDDRISLSSTVPKRYSSQGILGSRGSSYETDVYIKKSVSLDTNCKLEIKGMEDLNDLRTFSIRKNVVDFGISPLSNTPNTRILKLDEIFGVEIIKSRLFSPTLPRIEEIEESSST